MNPNDAEKVQQVDAPGSREIVGIDHRPLRELLRGVLGFDVPFEHLADPRLLGVRVVGPQIRAPGAGVLRALDDLGGAAFGEPDLAVLDPAIGLHPSGRRTHELARLAPGDQGPASLILDRQLADRRIYELLRL